MATDAFTPGTARQTVGTDQTSSTVVDVLWMVLTAFASLKLTVVLLCFSIALVLIGTLAQAYEDVWSVVDNYFRTERAYVPFQVFFPPAWFPNMTSVPGGFWFPGGYTIGTLMGINLLAAHGMRFKIQATGTRLWAGLGVIALGCVICGVFITIQQESESLTSIVTNEWNILWSGIALAAGLLWATATYRLFAVPTKNPWDRWVWASAGLVSGLLFCYLVMVWFQEANAPLSGVYTRILWQLIKAFIAASVLLVGCTMVFRKRGGIVLLHAGLMLMMANELVVENWHIETQTSLAAGDKANWTQDIRTPELAIIDNTDPKEEKVVIVPKSMLDSKQRIKDDRLPFDLQVVEYMENSTLIPPTKDTPNRATAGNGLDDIAVAKPVSAGASASSSVNTPSAYVDLFEKGTDKKIGTYLLSTMWMDDHAPERVKVGDNKVYDLSLRFKRYYKPYSVEMLKASKDNYIGTDTPRNYSSDVRLIDPQRGVDRKVHISMNNPFRYGGETFYQSGHTPAAGGPISTLSVVKNGGWMIPYLGCMIVFVGMAAQFGTTLRRFTERKSADQPMVMGDSLAALKRKVGGTDKSKKGPEILKAELAEEPSALIKYRWAFSVAAVLLVAAFLASKARTPSASPSEMDLYKLGQIPVIEGGRLKPFDSLARESLSQIADRQTYIDAAGKRQPAIRWLLDVIAKPDAAQQHKIFRIHNREVLALFGITSEPDARVKIEPGGRYSLAQLLPKMEEFDAQLQAIQKRDTPSSQYSTYE
ncbi:MAG: cytochrome c biogenesis protein ResB, partial [Planctomycetota bacterium]|nr:cytochrome c biogenesis protein ResB [Planctomycetota bacterium]